ncbi:MAG: phosphatidylglycerophosphatase A [Phycisphaerae bacterium]|nr:phosphatidylglycerophosphatase A [Phycisphaerae bacterium]
MKFLRKLLVTGLGTGYLPIAPGTWGSAATCCLFALVLWRVGPNSWILAGVMTGVVIVGCAGCVAWGSWMRQAFGRKDPSQCTLDEWAGQAIALIHVPLGAGWGWHGLAIGVAFLAFRLFDITKPPPARQAEAFPDGLGVVADDLIAGVYANIVAQLILRFTLNLLA